MKRTWTAALAILAACGSSGGPPDEPTPADPRPSGTDVPREFLAIAPAQKLTGNGKTYILRYVVEQHPGFEDQLLIVTLGSGDQERAATVQEYYEAMALRQQEVTQEAGREEKILREFFRADELRADDALDSRIVIKEEVIQDFEVELSRLSRQIDAERAIPAPESEKRISFWLQELARREKEHRVKKLELAVLRYKRNLREQLILGKVGPPQVRPEVEPRVQGADRPPKK